VLGFFTVVVMTERRPGTKWWWGWGGGGGGGVASMPTILFKNSRICPPTDAAIAANETAGAVLPLRLALVDTHI